MTKEELAAQITGREYPFELLPAEKRIAKDSGLIVIYGASDDLVMTPPAKTGGFSVALQTS
jgi:hypothetical protein